MEGRGEKVTPLPSLPLRWVVLVIPPVPREPGKTKRLYARLKPSHHTDGHITQRFVKELKAGGEPTPSFLFNTFESVTFTRFSELAKYRSHITRMGASNVHLAGSGPALFSLIEDRAEAEDLHVRCQQEGLESYLIDTVPASQEDW